MDVAAMIKPISRAYGHPDAGRVHPGVLRIRVPRA
jgi:hypothetical protein